MLSDVVSVGTTGVGLKHALAIVGPSKDVRLAVSPHYDYLAASPLTIGHGSTDELSANLIRRLDAHTILYANRFVVLRFPSSPISLI